MPLLDIPTIYVLMLSVMVLLGALKAPYTAKALGRNRVEQAGRLTSRPEGGSGPNEVNRAKFAGGA